MRCAKTGRKKASVDMVINVYLLMENKNSQGRNHPKESLLLQLVKIKHLKSFLILGIKTLMNLRVMRDLNQIKKTKVIKVILKKRSRPLIRMIIKGL
jgi:hypothetical protein